LFTPAYDIRFNQKSAELISEISFNIARISEVKHWIGVGIGTEFN